VTGGRRAVDAVQADLDEPQKNTWDVGSLQRRLVPDVRQHFSSTKCLKHGFF
jgi:hypothetical protein